MVTKVNENRIMMRMTFPPDSQNSASPYAFTARKFRMLHVVLVSVDRDLRYMLIVWYATNEAETKHFFHKKSSLIIFAILFLKLARNAWISTSIGQGEDIVLTRQIRIR